MRDIEADATLYCRLTFNEFFIMFGIDSIMNGKYFPDWFYSAEQNQSNEVEIFRIRL